MQQAPQAASRSVACSAPLPSRLASARTTSSPCLPLRSTSRPLLSLQDFLTLPAYDILVAEEFGPTFGAGASGGTRSRL